MSLSSAPVARTQMLIRRPVAEVFEAFIDPDITARFWFSRGSERLQAGRTVTWSWDMYDFEVQVEVKALERDRRLLIAWPTAAEWTFTDRGDGTTFVVIEASGFEGDADSKVADAIDQAGGFSFVLAGCKAFLEHGIELHLVADHAPPPNERGAAD